MDVKSKILVCVLPILGGIAIIATLVMPAFDEFNQKAKSLDEKKTEHQDLQTKLADKDKITKEVHELNNTIDQLRSAVPRKAQTEILNLDIEKMCLDSGMEMISFTEPDAETLKKAGLAEESPQAGTNMTKGKQALADKVNKTLGAVPAAAGAAAAAATGPKVKKSDPGLARVTVTVKAIGDYSSAEKLIRKLETYKRVVAISELKAWVPKREDVKKGAAQELPDDAELKDDDPQGDWKRLWVSFMLTAYYLP
jgi:Tfp pilus assembly protein PilO